MASSGQENDRRQRPSDSGPAVFPFPKLTYDSISAYNLKDSILLEMCSFWWAILQQPATRHAVQEHLITAAATTGTLVRKGITETKEKVSVGKIKMEEATKKTAQKSKTILTDIERWQKGVASSDVFGVPIEIIVQRQESNRPIPLILIKCAYYLILTGLNSSNLFKAEGDKKLIQQLVSAYNQDPSASIPEGVNPVDVAALMKYYLATLPTPFQAP
ncbi:uncharacterized Rho GTPase-activating protein At5g61530 [Arabidopsis lyrata subsp. lyrata]|uniref:uncharacterized Rho GTPase-activating protein At5g61530 n=1 Tax=Arabidopsis lyrata subsp. lyrata TaxID=81972 RepID=UPI000A29C62A|nr:uncharacterized Rho GTPase-activating protein At5g61530 [Arabidopsis lyrata subsp. lyrata]|eukprot:XP_020874137.1 uncharacterized Rho GTPase-activating protein At5g61530 [Arabidopsis lyrata subsp. lyrata]